MKYQELLAKDDDAELLVQIRIEAMEESLEALGRFNLNRARDRFLDTFEAQFTTKIAVDGLIIGFYVIKKFPDHILLDHFYIKPDYQSKGIGSSIISSIKKNFELHKLPIRLGALRNSKSNDFYKNNGFIPTHQGEWDNYYEFKLN